MQSSAWKDYYVSSEVLNFIHRTRYWHTTKLYLYYHPVLRPIGLYIQGGPKKSKPKTHDHNFVKS